ncbi:MAG: hypothetical protein Q4F21_12715 [Lachnospiraceae bacterium]|nr:hypothetical protein [Lachnospiraceae bacterium]
MSKILKKQDEKHDWAYLILFLTVLFLFGIQDAVQDDLKIFQYLDEAFGLLIVPAFMLRWYQKSISCRISRRQALFITLFAVFWLSGWVGVLQYHYQPMANVLKDAYVALKFFLTMGASYLIFREIRDFRWMEKKLWYAANAATAVLTCFCILDLMFGLFYTETRYGFPAIKLFYSSYTALVAVCCVLCAIYLRLYERYRNKILIPLAFLFFVMMNTKRVKAVGAMLCIFVIYMYAFHRGKKISRKIWIPALICAVIAVGSMVWQLIYYYYQLGYESARLIMTIAAPYITKDYLPFGTGWATFGSAFSAEPYSPVYTMYGMNVVWGISPTYHQFISDTFWPMILVENGVLGLAAYIGALILLILRILQFRKRNASVFASAIFPILYLLIASSSESAFVNPLAVPFAFWIGFLFAEDYRNLQMEKSV